MLNKNENELYDLHETVQYIFKRYHDDFFVHLIKQYFGKTCT